jgi:hypothetical protein
MKGTDKDAKPGDEPPAEPEADVLRESVKRIVVTRERTPRGPAWQRTWWRTLVRYNRRLAQLREEEERRPDPGPDDGTS